MNRRQRRIKPKPRHMHESAADIGLKHQLIRSEAIRIATEAVLQRMLWMTAVALNDVEGWGPTRIKRFMDAMQSVSDEWEAMARDGDSEYATEKLRQKAATVSGMTIGYAEDEKQKEENQDDVK